MALPTRKTIAEALDRLTSSENGIAGADEDLLVRSAADPYLWVWMLDCCALLRPQEGPSENNILIENLRLRIGHVRFSNSGDSGGETQKPRHLGPFGLLWEQQMSYIQYLPSGLSVSATQVESALQVLDHQLSPDLGLRNCTTGVSTLRTSLSQMYCPRGYESTKYNILLNMISRQVHEIATVVRCSVIDHTILQTLDTALKQFQSDAAYFLHPKTICQSRLNGCNTTTITDVGLQAKESEYDEVVPPRKRQKRSVL